MATRNFEDTQFIRLPFTEEPENPAAEYSAAEVLKDVYRVLALCLGVPPKEFTWRKDGFSAIFPLHQKVKYRQIFPACPMHRPTGGASHALTAVRTVAAARAGKARLRATVAGTASR